MIRAVLDANIVVSAYPATVRTLSDLFVHWPNHHFDVVTSEYIIREIEPAWNKAYWQSRFHPAAARTSLMLFRDVAEMTEVPLPIGSLATHPEDDYILATALSSDADLLVTGDKQLLQLEHIGRTIIVSPVAFLARLNDEFPGQR
jgi:putative PIN family toxin of toxin-antitoxin system